MTTILQSAYNEATELLTFGRLILITNDSNLHFFEIQ